MYSTNLSKIQINEFKETLKNIQLLPSHKLLLANIDLIEKLKMLEITIVLVTTGMLALSGFAELI